MKAEKYIKDELSSIEALLSKVYGQTEEIRQTIKELQEQLERLGA